MAQVKPNVTYIRYYGGKQILPKIWQFLRRQILRVVILQCLVTCKKCDLVKNIKTLYTLACPSNSYLFQNIPYNYITNCDNYVIYRIKVSFDLLFKDTLLCFMCYRYVSNDVEKGKIWIGHWPSNMFFCLSRIKENCSEVDCMKDQVWW